MKKTAGIVLSLLLLVPIIFSWSFYAVGAVSLSENEFLVKANVRFTASGGAWNFSKEEKEISLYMNSTWQTVMLVNSSYSFENIKTDEDGNKLAILNMPSIEPNQSIEYTVFYRVLSKPRNIPGINKNTALNLTAIPSNLSQAYLEKSGTWMTNNATIRALAETLSENQTTVLAIIEKFVRWIWDNIEYGSNEVPLYPNETLSQKRGDCDDQAILLVSMCRVVGIPAYLQIGSIYSPQVENETSTGWEGHVESIQNHVGWHGWAMVYVPPWEWLPVDLTYIYAFSKNDALNAIKTAAVTSQRVIQYMNIIQTDYVSKARDYRGFLINNDFYIQTFDEIIAVREANPFEFLSEWLNTLVKYVLVTLLVAGVIVGVLVGLFYARRMKKRGIVDSTAGNSRVLCGCKFSWHPLRLLR